MNNHIPTLDGWRGVAITMVLFYHLLGTAFEKGTTPYWVVHHGAKGVDIFFALSGFLITTRLLEERRADGGINLRKFYIRRIFRILPPYLAYLTIITLLATLGIITVTKRELISCLLFYRNYIPAPDQKNWYTAHFWTLSVEEHFYVIFPLVLACCSARKSLYIAATSAIAVAAWRKIHSHAWPLEFSGLGRTDLRIDGLIWGAFVAIMTYPTEVKDRILKYFKPAMTWSLLALLIALIWYELPFGLTIEAFLIPWMLFGTINNTGSILALVLESSSLKWIGRLSYSLYIWQQLFISRLWSEIHYFNNNEYFYCFFAITFTVLFSMTSHHFIERPLLEFGRRISRRWDGRSGGRIELIPSFSNLR